VGVSFFVLLFCGFLGTAVIWSHRKTNEESYKHKEEKSSHSENSSSFVTQSNTPFIHPGTILLEGMNSNLFQPEGNSLVGDNEGTITLFPMDSILSEGDSFLHPSILSSGDSTLQNKGKTGLFQAPSILLDGKKKGFIQPKSITLDGKPVMQAGRRKPDR
jgi:hypothetical protein